TAAGLSVKEYPVIGDAEPSRQGRDPGIVGGYLDGVSAKSRNNNPSRIIIVCSPVEAPFNADNEVAELVVAPNLTAANEYAVVVSAAEVQAGEAVGHVIMCPSSANVAPDIEPRPTKGRCHHRRLGVDRRRLKISCTCSHWNGQQSRHRNARIKGRSHG